jgi:hypothetical protein
MNVSLDDSVVPTTIRDMSFKGAFLPNTGVIQPGESVEEYNKRNWPQYGFGDEKMLSLLRPEDLVGKHPRARALRQLIVRVVGPITNEYCIVSQFGVSELGYHAVVVNTINVFPKNPLWQYNDGQHLSSSAAADALTGNGDYAGNMAEGFNKFPTANADTRAKARSYIGLLGLNINAAEEMSDDDKAVTFSKTKLPNDDPIASNVERQAMLSVMSNFTEKTGTALDPEKVVLHLGFKYNELTKKQVMAVNTAVQGWSRNPKSFPKEFNGGK